MKTQEKIIVENKILDLIHDPGYSQSIINSLEDEMTVIDKDYRVIQVNEAFLKRHNMSREQVIGQYCYDVSHGLPELCHPPRLECPIKAVWETGKTARVTHCHVYDTGDEKSNRYLDIIVSPITDGNNKIVAVVELMRDVTETKSMEIKVAEANRNLLALNAIASVVSQSLDLDTVLASALDKTLEIMKVNTGGIMLWDEEKQSLCYQVHHGLSGKYVRDVCSLPGEGIAWKVAQSATPVLVEDITREPGIGHVDLITEEEVRAFASVPLLLKERVLGVVNIASHEAHKFNPEDMRLLDNIAAQIAIAVENAKLHQEVQHKDEVRGELLHQIFSIQEEERRRIARELHDETSQVLASMTANLEAALSMLPEGSEKARIRIKKAEALSLGILDEVHKLIYELRPTLLDDLGLVAASRWLAENNLKSAGVKVSFRTVGVEKRLPPQMETTLFRVIQEAINNIARHAEAKNTAVQLHFMKNAIKVNIKDNGKGFDVEEAISSKDRPRGLGLIGMKERIQVWNGTIKIESSPGGRGTRIMIQIPLSEVESGE